MKFEKNTGNLAVFIGVATILTAALAVLDAKVLATEYPSFLAVPAAYGALGGIGFVALSSGGYDAAAQSVLAAGTSAAASALATRILSRPTSVKLPEYKVL